MRAPIRIREGSTQKKQLHHIVLCLRFWIRNIFCLQQLCVAYSGQRNKSSIFIVDGNAAVTVTEVVHNRRM